MNSVQDTCLHVLSFDAVPPPECRGGAIAIGNFDGVHLGHAALVRELVAQARSADGPAVVLSFEPHPLQLLAPERFMPILTTPADRADLLRRLGVDVVVYLRTAPQLLTLSPAEFFERFVHGGFRATSVIEGFNFRFGKDRTGDTEVLAGMCKAHGMRFTKVPPFELDGAPVSSSRVRDALVAGKVDTAARLLSRNYQISGVVVEGRRRGRTIGFPTANLGEVAVLLPGDGVYAVRVRLGDVWHAGAANVGANPTFGESERKVEVHILDFAGELYGRRLIVEFVQKLRDTLRFSNADALADQLRRDAAQARQIVAESCDGP